MNANNGIALQPTGQFFVICIDNSLNNNRKKNFNKFEFNSLFTVNSICENALK